MNMEQNEQYKEYSFFDIKQIVALRNSGVYVIINDNKKMCQVFGSRNMLNGLVNLMNNIDTSEYGEMSIHVDELTLLVCEYTEDVKVMCSKWTDHYRNNGYRFYKERYLPHYKVVAEVATVNNEIKCLVVLKNIRKDRIVLGMFNSMDEANIWMNTTYPNGVIDKVVYNDDNYVNILNKRT